MSDEFYGVVKASGFALGQRSLFCDLGSDLRVRVWTDSTATIGICFRQGLGKLRHIDTHSLWVQEKVRSKAIELTKVHGESNPEDLLTKHLSTREKLEQLVTLFGCTFTGRRALAAPLLRKRTEPEADHECEVDVIEDSDESGLILVHEAVLHDLELWPHMHKQEVMDRMFPLVTAAPEIEASSPEALGEHEALHRRWATIRIVDRIANADYDLKGMRDTKGISVQS